MARSGRGDRVAGVFTAVFAWLTGSPLARRTGELLHGQAARLIGVVLLSVTGSLGVLVTPFVVRALVDGVVAGTGTAVLWPPLLVVLAVAVAQAGVLALRMVTTAALGETVASRMRTTLYRHALRVPFGFYPSSESGAFLTLLANDVSNVQVAMAMDIPALLAGAANLLVVVAAVLVLDWRLTLVALVSVPLAVLLVRIARGHATRTAATQLAGLQELIGVVSDTTGVSGALQIRLFRRQDHEEERFLRLTDRVRRLGIRRTRIEALVRFAVTVMGALVAVATVGVGMWLVSTGATSIGTVAGFAAALASLYLPLSSMAESRTRLAAAGASLTRIYAFLDVPVSRPALQVRERPPAETAVPAGNHAAGGEVPDLELRDVWFSYDRARPDRAGPTGPAGRDAAPYRPERWALRGVNLRVRAGEKVAVVGPSGSGKTTLGYLATAIYPPASGRVLIRGTDAADLDDDRLRALVGCVPQDPFLFNDTIAANLRYGRLDATEEEMWAALEAANLHDTVHALPDRLATRVGARGHRLSGGERQRMAIARAILQDPRILVLDEATSQMDAENERLVNAALQRLSADRTCLVIAHRLSTVVDADHIVVLADGAIVERGRHRDLVNGGPVYSRLYAQQAGPDRTDE